MAHSYGKSRHTFKGILISPITIFLGEKNKNIDINETESLLAATVDMCGNQKVPLQGFLGSFPH